MNTKPPVTASPTAQLLSGIVPAEQKLPGRPLSEHVFEERAARDQPREADQREARRAHSLRQLDQPARADGPQGHVIRREVCEEQRRGEDHATLEAAAGGLVTMGDDVEPDKDGRRDQPEAGHADRQAGLRHVPARRIVIGAARALAEERPQDARHTDHGGEQDELLAERVEAAVVEVHGGDDVVVDRSGTATRLRMSPYGPR